METRTRTIAAALLVATVAAAEEARVAYPEGYRHWTHVKSMVIEPGHALYEQFGGIHHVYANDAALAAVKAGRPYPDGAVWVFDLLEAKREGNAVVEGPRKVLGVMQKDSKRFAATGGWGFEAFAGDTRDRVVADGGKGCFDCHAGRGQSDFVFSNYRP